MHVHVNVIDLILHISNQQDQVYYSTAYAGHCYTKQ